MRQRLKKECTVEFTSDNGNEECTSVFETDAGIYYNMNHSNGIVLTRIH